MGRVLLGAGLTAIYLLAQGILILRTGRVNGIGAYFGKPSRSESKPAFGMVLFSAAMHIVPAFAVFTLLVMVGLKHHLTMSEVAEHLRAAGQNILFALFLMGPGIYAIVRPSGALGWARTAQPEIPADDPWYLLSVRVIGAALYLNGLGHSVCCCFIITN